MSRVGDKSTSDGGIWKGWMKAESQGRWLEAPGPDHGREQGCMGETLKKPLGHVGAPNKAQGSWEVRASWRRWHIGRGEEWVKTAIFEMGLGEEQVWERC